MKSLLKSIVIFSALGSIIYGVVLAFNLYGLIAKQTSLNAELHKQTVALKEAQDKLKNIKAQSNYSSKPARIHEVVADFLLILETLPPEVKVANIKMDSNLDKTEKDNKDLPYSPVEITLSYTDYTALVALTLDLFAYSPILLTLESMTILPDTLTLDMRLYGVTGDE